MSVLLFIIIHKSIIIPLELHHKLSLCYTVTCNAAWMENASKLMGMHWKNKQPFNVSAARELNFTRQLAESNQINYVCGNWSQ